MRKFYLIVLGLSLSLFIFLPIQLFAQANWFQTGQDAYIILSAIGFNDTGGSLLFNHPMNIASDGTRLLLADTRNNRILIWNSLPGGNVEPDIVLGQENFTTNGEGTSLSQLNWPVGVATAEGKVIVADTYNDRILIWNTFPTAHAQPADLSIETNNVWDQKKRIEWPWDVWTDGTKLLVTSTAGRSVFIYNTFPTIDNQTPDLYLYGKSPDDGTDRFGTPRTIGTDGESYLIIGDHNPVGESTNLGSFFWNSFPSTDNQAYDYYMPHPRDPNQMMWGGVKTSGGKFVTVATPGIAIWNSVPTSVVPPDLFVAGGSNGSGDGSGYYFNNGDGSDLVATSSGKLYISLYNNNMVVGFNSLPTLASQRPDFAIGSSDIDTNTLDTNYIVTNGIPATNGSSFFVSSDFDKKLYVWKSIPAESGTHPDTVYELEFAPWDNALHNDIFIMGGKQEVQIWTDNLPLSGNLPDLTFKDQIGSISFQEIRGIALDSRYLYISDEMADKLYVWGALPDSTSSPLFSIDIEGPGRLSSDGNFLTVTLLNGNRVQIYDVGNLSNSSLPVKEISTISNLPQFSSINLPQAAFVSEGHFFVADTNLHRVFCWENITDAINGNFPEVVLGKQDFSSRDPGRGKNSLFWPAGLVFHRNKLWVSEFKFSGRLLGYKYQTSGAFIEVTPTFGDFDEVEIGSSLMKSFIISNTGTENLEIGEISITGTNSSDFSIQSDNCSGSTIAPSGNCTLNVTFSPTSAGQKNALLNISSNDTNTPNLSIPLKKTASQGGSQPTVTTSSATSVTSSSATLNGIINPNGLSASYYFEYGTSTSYGSQTESKDAGSGEVNVSVSAGISNLSASISYHFRLVVSSSAGTSYGSDLSFTTTETGGGGGSGGDEGEGGGNCFIATACYGSVMAEEVQTLSAFRDKYLMTNAVGRTFVRLYYRLSPKVADIIRRREYLKRVVREGLKPLIWIAKQFLN